METVSLDDVGGLLRILVREEDVPGLGLLGADHVGVVGKHLHAREDRRAPLVAVDRRPVGFRERGVDVAPVGEPIGVERGQEVTLDELEKPVARHGDDVGGGGGCLGREQVEQLALVVDEADVHLDSGLRLELLAKAVRDEIRVGPDVHLSALCMCPAKNGRGGQRGGAGGGGTEKAASGVPWCGHVVSPLPNRIDVSVARIVRRRSAGMRSPSQQAGTGGTLKIAHVVALQVERVQQLVLRREIPPIHRGKDSRPGFV